MRSLFLMFVVVISVVCLTGAENSNSAELSCEAQRDRVQVRLQITQETLEQREKLLADLVVRYGQLEAENKKLKSPKSQTEKEKQ